MKKFWSWIKKSSLTIALVLLVLATVATTYFGGLMPVVVNFLTQLIILNWKLFGVILAGLLIIFGVWKGVSYLGNLSSWDREKILKNAGITAIALIVFAVLIYGAMKVNWESVLSTALTGLMWLIPITLIGAGLWYAHEKGIKISFSQILGTLAFLPSWAGILLVFATLGVIGFTVWHISSSAGDDRREIITELTGKEVELFQFGQNIPVKFAPGEKKKIYVPYCADVTFSNKCKICDKFIYDGKYDEPYHTVGDSMGCVVVIYTNPGEKEFTMYFDIVKDPTCERVVYDKENGILKQIEKTLKK